MTSQFSLPWTPLCTWLFLGRKGLRILLIASMVFLSLCAPAQAAICRNIQGRRICEASLNRSAKNYWEYRAIVTIDGARQPQEIYNCRDRLRVQVDGTVIPFTDGDPSPLVCRLYNKRQGKRS
jgi:hypothetical protein